MTVRPEQLPASFGGEIIEPAHPGYDRARQIWKGLDRRPALIARCADVSDVQRVIEHAASEDIPLAVSGAGHDIAARSMPDGALVASTLALDGIEIDPVRRLARVQAGVRWGSLVAAAARHGLATTGASVATVGVAGFALHGGLGWLMRSFGTACDNIQALDVVTADGQLRTVDARSDPDLFWAMRGAGSNFGAITSLTLRLHPVSRVVAGVKLYPAAKARDVFDAYRRITADAGDELVTHFYYNGNPDGTHSVGIGLCFNGPAATAAAALAPWSLSGSRRRTRCGRKESTSFRWCTTPVLRSAPDTICVLIICPSSATTPPMRSWRIAEASVRPSHRYSWSISAVLSAEYRTMPQHFVDAMPNFLSS